MKTNSPVEVSEVRDNRCEKEQVAKKALEFSREIRCYTYA